MVSSRLRRLARAMSWLSTSFSAPVGQVRMQAGPSASNWQRSHFTATARTPGSSRETRRRAQAQAARGRFRAVDVGRDMQRAAAGEFNRAERTGDAAEFAAHAQAFIELNRPRLAGDGVRRTDLRARRVFAVVAQLRGGIFLVTHNRQARPGLQSMQAVRLRTGGLTGVAADAERGVGNDKTVHQVFLR